MDAVISFALRQRVLGQIEGALRIEHIEEFAPALGIDLIGQIQRQTVGRDFIIQSAITFLLVAVGDQGVFDVGERREHGLSKLRQRLLLLDRKSVV